ncbi:hypothetical protein SEA_PEGGYLEG03_62 [Arthrobacter phage PeggyLeg03]|nr:hypothetical protein SEA_PEGGYLEG03_62 [Arthrobacter phage PeggyLeg03]
MIGIIQQQCPFPGCEETLTFNVTQIPRPDEDYGFLLTIRAESTPESTEHAYSHREPAK